MFLHKKETITNLSTMAL